MNALDILKYGEATFQESLKRIPSSQWEREGVCGWWSVKHIIAHLASYEILLEEILSEFSDTPILTPLMSELESIGAHGFNDSQVGQRQSRNIDEVLLEYQEAHQRSSALALGVPDAKWSEVGTLPWYGDEYSLDDFIVYS